MKYFLLTIAIVLSLRTHGTEGYVDLSPYLSSETINFLHDVIYHKSLGYDISVLKTPYDQIVIILGESHVKNEEEHKIGLAFLDKFKHRLIESRPGNEFTTSFSEDIDILMLRMICIIQALWSWALPEAVRFQSTIITATKQTDSISFISPSEIMVGCRHNDKSGYSRMMFSVSEISPFEEFRGCDHTQPAPHTVPIYASLYRLLGLDQVKPEIFLSPSDKETLVKKFSYINHWLEDTYSIRQESINKTSNAIKTWEQKRYNLDYRTLQYHLVLRNKRFAENIHKITREYPEEKAFLVIQGMAHNEGVIEFLKHYGFDDLEFWKNR